MTGREKIEAAFSKRGTPEVPAVICYEGLVSRDHWDELTRCPWWYRLETDVERQIAWQRDAIAAYGQDWFTLPYAAARDARGVTRIEERSDGVFRVNVADGSEERLERPQPGGSAERYTLAPRPLPRTAAEVDAAIPVAEGFDAAAVERDGRRDIAARLADRAREKFPIVHVISPLWRLYGVWGFEGMMTLVAQSPELAAHACRRLLTLARREVDEASELGAAGVWIEECMTDMISPAAFAELNAPYVRILAESIRSAAMKSIYYYCGNPAGKWESIISVGADAYAFEEGKKGWQVDIEEVVDRVAGRAAVLGNLDAINLLPDASEDELAAEISRQIAAGRRNGGRFIMSTGSPVTPGTSLSRIRLYCDLVHKLGGS